jgi:hypothetical protein
VRDGRDTERRRQHQADGEQADRAHVAPQLAQVEKKAAEYSSGGNAMSSTSSGERRTSGTPGTKPSEAPPTVSQMGYGSRVT